MTDIATAPELERIDAHTLRFERTLDAPPETVWRYLTDGHLRALWFAGGATDAREGGTITMTFDHDNLSAEPSPYPETYASGKGRSVERPITRFDPPHVFAFMFGDEGGTVTFELSRSGEGRTRLVLTHEGITGPAPMRNYAGGWHAHLAALAALLKGGQLRDFWAQHAASEKTVAAVLD